jgi:hypothetical protein
MKASGRVISATVSVCWNPPSTNEILTIGVDLYILHLAG